MNNQQISVSAAQTINVFDMPARSPQESCDRIVVFLDTMGFKDLVARQLETNIDKKLHELSVYISSLITPDNYVQFSIFSDSIILFSNESTIESFRLMVGLSASIVEKSISLGLPIRGAMSSGICTVTNDKVPYYFGQPIVDAYTLEENTVLYGVVLHNTVEQFAEQLKNEPNLIFDFNVILKGGASNHYIVNWFSNNYDENHANLLAIRKTVSDSPRRYIDATISSFQKWEKLHQ